MADIFISYSRAERDLTMALARDLEAQGFTVWWDTSLLPGDDFPDEIKLQIEAARAAIVIWSESSVGSKWVKAEAQRADAQGKLITVHAPGLDLRTVPMPYNIMQSADLSERAKIYAALEKRGVKGTKVREVEEVRRADEAEQALSVPASQTNSQSHKASLYAPVGEEKGGEFAAAPTGAPPGSSYVAETPADQTQPPSPKVEDEASASTKAQLRQPPAFRARVQRIFRYVPNSERDQEYYKIPIVWRCIAMLDDFEFAAYCFALPILISYVIFIYTVAYEGEPLFSVVVLVIVVLFLNIIYLFIAVLAVSIILAGIRGIFTLFGGECLVERAFEKKAVGGSVLAVLWTIQVWPFVSFLFLAAKFDMNVAIIAGLLIAGGAFTLILGFVKFVRPDILN